MDRKQQKQENLAESPKADSPKSEPSTKPAIKAEAIAELIRQRIEKQFLKTQKLEEKKKKESFKDQDNKLLLKLMESQNHHDKQFKFLDGKYMNQKFETQISRDIRILSEVEKIWIMYDCDQDGKLDKDEITNYIKFMAQPALDIDDKNVDEIFSLIDRDQDGQIDKKEMEAFLKTMMILQQNLTFKKSQEFLEHCKQQKCLRNKKAKLDIQKDGEQSQKTQEKEEYVQKLARLNTKAPGKAEIIGRQTPKVLEQPVFKLSRQNLMKNSDITDETF